MNMNLRWSTVALALLVGCARMTRDCASSLTQTEIGNWVVVQTRMDGSAFRCWQLWGVSISNEPNSDGIFWQESVTGNLVHISNLYNRVQVVNNHWDRAFAELGLTQDRCDEIRRARDGDASHGR